LNFTNGFVVFNEGQLIVPMTNNFFLKSNNMVTVAPNDEKVKVSFDARTGLLLGSFLHPDITNKLTSYWGAVLQDQNYGAGFFLGTNQSGSVTLEGN
jgi:hypothetical protein